MKIIHRHLVAVLVSGIVITNSAAWAADTATQPTQIKTNAWLTDHGITPHIMLSQLWLGNPSAGTNTHENSSYTMVFAGADLNLDQLDLIPGGSIHFMQLWVPFSHNEDFGNSEGGLLAGDPAPYTPKTAHLLRFGYEQKLLDDRLSMEIGKSNPGQFFGFNNCNMPQSCVNTILNKTAGFAPAPYAGWGVRARYQISSELESGAGAWRTYQAFPFTTGWERWDDVYATGSTLLVANVAKRVNWQQEAYPLNWEILGFHNNMNYDDVYYTVNNTSKVYDTESAVKTHTGVSGVYLTAKKALWRSDNGTNPQDTSPSAISLHGSVTQTFGSDVYTGVSTLADAGLIWSAPFRSRPMDSYGLTFRWGRLTRSEQHYLQDMFDSYGGSGWTVPRNEYQLGLDASIMATPDINLQFSAARTWNNSNWQYTYVSVKPESGYTFWLQANVMVEKMLGL